MAIDTSKIVRLANGLSVANCTPHVVRMQDGGQIVVLENTGATLLATPAETEVGSIGAATLVKAVFNPSETGAAELEELEALATEIYGGNLVILGSLISAQAYPGRVLGMVPVKGTERSGPAEKVFRSDRFTTFG